MRSAIIVFVRNPEKGKVKTRLAATMGEEKALQVYRVLLRHTYDITLAADKKLFVFYSDTPVAGDLWQGGHIEKRQQQGEDLGERMAHAFEQVFAEGYDQVIIIGSDCYELNADIILQAFALLEERDIVIGPAKDGGYYLLGQKKHQPALFRDKAWSTATVYEETISSCREEGLHYAVLPLLQDVDVEADINFSYS